MNTTGNDINRPLANVTPTPSLWGDQFLSYTPDPQVIKKYSKEIEGLKNQVRSMVTNPEGTLVDTINLIDTLERLGLSYHFEIEIEEKLKQFFNLIKTEDYKDEAYDLYTVALHFRLFRQHGYPISTGIFEKWMDGNGKFQEKVIKNDAKGLLSLYEACILRTHGDTLLDDALVFATANLKSMAANLGSPLRKQVEHALFQCLHYGIQRIEARYFMSIYEEEQHKSETLLRFAKLDYNALQIQYRKELSEVTRWWKELDLTSKLTYARDRMVECYFWAVGVYHEPQYSRARILVAKCIAFSSVMDDTYDSYATIEELDLLTAAFDKWDIKQIDTLPEYIKPFYKALLEIYDEFKEELAKEGRSYAAHYAIEHCKELARSYHVEAKWFLKGYMPAFEEYLNNALITSTVNYHVMIMFMGMQSITKKDYEWLSSIPKMLKATQLINRLVDDIATYEGEKEKGQAATGIECYMKEKGVTKEEAMKHFAEGVTNAWKDSNEECLALSSQSRDL